MTVNIVVPNLPESVSDATLLAWHKKPGDSVTKDEPLVDLETDKVVLEVPAPDSGVLTSVEHSDGAIVLSGDIIGYIDTNSSANATPAPSTKPQQEPKAVENETNNSVATREDSEPHLSPAVRRLVTENQLDPRKITEATGKDGRLTKADVINFLQKNEAVTPTNTPQVEPDPVPQIRKEPTSSSNETFQQWDDLTDRPEQRVPMTRLRARIAERLLQAQQNAAMLTTFNEVNLQNVIELRNKYKTHFEQRHDVKLGFMSFFVKAAIEALRQFPVINASVDEDAIIYHGYYDIGIAVSSERGLVVPIIRDADQHSFADIEKTIRDFGIRARASKITHQELTGGTFTITNGGIFGSMMSTPILNPPQSGILGMHAIKERPIAENGQVVIRPMMYLAFSYDHRIVDGREAVQFLVAIKDALEDPARLLLSL